MGAERIFETQKKELSGDGISIRYDIAICKNRQCVWGKFRIFRQFFFCVREGWGQEAFCLTVKNIKKRKIDVNNKQMLSDIYCNRKNRFWKAGLSGNGKESVYGK